MDKSNVLNDLILNKILDKATIAYERNYSTFTDFLDLNEQSIFLNNKKALPAINYTMVGGYEESERRQVLFYPEFMDIEEIQKPYSIIKISPVNNNYTDNLTHRDFLGAILNLGIVRSKIGDILIKNNVGYVICTHKMAEFIVDNLFIIRNTNVSIIIIDSLPEEAIEFNYKIIKQTVASIRLDNIIKVALSISRTNAVNLIKSSKVFVNSCVNENISSSLNEGDIISIRGYGKYKLFEIGNITKKGRVYIVLYKYA